MDNNLLGVFRKVHPGGVPFNYQEEWILDNSPFKLGVKARQIGITTSEACADFIDCLFWRPSDYCPEPPIIVFTSPSMRQSSRLMNYIQRVRTNFEKQYKDSIYLKKEREDLIQFDNGAEIFSLPNNPRTIEGIDAWKGVIDEFGNFQGQEDRQIYESLMGSLGAKGGGISVFGKPRGRRGLFWELYNPFGGFSRQFSKHKFTWKVRAKQDPLYKKTVLDQKKRMTSLAFSEHYECEFVDESIVIFSYDLIDSHTENYALWTDRDGSDGKGDVHIGIDFGKKTSDTVVTIVVKESEKIRVKYIKATRKPFDEQIDWISFLIVNFKPVHVKIDKTGIGQSLEEKLISRFGNHVIHGIHFSNKIKEQLIFNTLKLFEQNRLFIPDHNELKDQLHGIEKEVTESGNIKYSGKKTETDFKDDHAWSLFLACFEIDESEWSFSVIDSESNKKIASAKSVADYFREQEKKKWLYDYEEDEE